MGDQGEAPNRASIASLADQIESIASRIEASGELSNDNALQQRFLTAAGRLNTVLENPRERIHAFACQPMENAAVRVAVELNLFDIIFANAQEARSTPAKELATTTGAEELLVVRVMRLACALGFAAETDIETYTANALTKTLTDAVSKATVKFVFDDTANVCLKIPEVVAKNGFKNPPYGEDPRNGVFQYARQTDRFLWEWYQDHPDNRANFHTYMSGSRRTRTTWLDFFPIEEKILRGAKDDRDGVLMVDVAGGKGHDLEAFRAKAPDAPGRLILQDLPDVIEQAGELKNGIEKMAYDFFTPQPIHGARVYYLHFILHDWPDASARQILRQLRPAMTPGYSKLLVDDFVLPDRGCPLYPCVQDMCMMGLLSGMERSRRQWTDLLASEGFEVVDVRTSGDENEGVVEAMVRE
ncbi:MAG: hypothetical protein M1837_000440 [Sclerophora amabilis]|nr:MAG: hypothetical protein M1837_000440 [Sclerophora amabilis]